MIYRFFIGFILVFVNVFIPAYAQQFCPDLAQIRNGEFNGWIAYSYQGERLNANELKVFQKDVQKFSQAQWLSGAMEGEAQCYYVNSQESYLAREHLKPDFFASQYWRWINSGKDVAACQKTTEKNCPFVD